MINQLKVLDLTKTKSGQSTTWIELLQFETHKLRLIIKSDSYIDQNRAIIERWNGERWYEVWMIPTGAMKTPASLYYHDDGLDNKHYRIDRATLLARALDVIQSRR